MGVLNKVLLTLGVYAHHVSRAAANIIIYSKSSCNSNKKFLFCNLQDKLQNQATTNKKKTKPNFFIS